MKRQVAVVIGIVALVALLVGAAFIGGRMLNAQPAAAGTGNKQISLSSNGPAGGKSFEFKTTQAKELPPGKADINGVFQSRTDTSIVVGTGRVSVAAQKQPDGTIQMSSNFDGPQMEIVVPHNATIYRDVTMKQYQNGPPADGQMQQVVEPGTLDEIGQNSMVQVWGEKTGDRIVASIVVYSLPDFIMVKPGAGAP